MSSNIQLFNMDCMEAMRQMPDKAFDLAIVDPPYGGGATQALVDGSPDTIRGGAGNVGAEGQVKVWGYL